MSKTHSPLRREVSRRLYQAGRLAFRSATEKDAFELLQLRTAELRRRLPTERRIKVLMIAWGGFERNQLVANANFVRARLQQLCAKENTAVTIHFEDGGQDFHEWDLNAEGCVIDSRPFQATMWCGDCVVNFEKLKVKGKVIIFRHHTGRMVVNYRIRALTPGPAAGQVKYPEHKPNPSVMDDKVSRETRKTARETRAVPVTAEQHNKYPRGRFA